jgi:hypothetical protein
MQDIIIQLGDIEDPRPTCERAIKEIERLRAALAAIAEDNPNQVRTPTMLATIARQALAWKGSSNE